MGVILTFHGQLFTIDSGGQTLFRSHEVRGLKVGKYLDGTNMFVGLGKNSRLGGYLEVRGARAFSSGCF